MKKTTLILIMVLTVCGFAHPEPLSSAEISSIFEQLCQTPIDGWIQEGYVEAIRYSFDAMTGERTEAKESVTTDGEKFLWQIQVNSVKKDKQTDPEKLKAFMEWNRERIFAWDGQTYTMYFKPGNHAITYEAPEIPVKVSGPLKAGLVPWGLGVFSPDSLANAQVSATQTQTDEGQQIEMTIRIEDQPEMRMLLDPDKNYAVRSYTLVRPQGFRTVQTYGNFVLQGERWIPMNILIERLDDDKLRSSDSWEIVSIRDQITEQDVFAASFQEKTLVEHYSPVLDKPAFYRHSNKANTKSLLDKRVVAGLKKGLGKQNCGTVAIEYILGELGVGVSDEELALLVNDGSDDTSLYQIRQLVEEKGLHCVAVKTNIQTLSKLKDYHVLLHLPKKKHFVVLDRVEKESVWVIDLDRQTFYHTMDMDKFDQRWAGIALVISEQAPLLGNTAIPVPEDIQKNIKGAAAFSCSKMIQEYDVILCPEKILGTCGGRYYMYYRRYECEISQNSEDFCKGVELVGNVYSPCVEESSNPGVCNVTGNWRVRKIRACEP